MPTKSIFRKFFRRTRVGDAVGGTEMEKITATLPAVRLSSILDVVAASEDAATVTLKSSDATIELVVSNGLLVKFRSVDPAPDKAIVDLALSYCTQKNAEDHGGALARVLTAFSESNGEITIFPPSAPPARISGALGHEPRDLLETCQEIQTEPVLDFEKIAPRVVDKPDDEPVGRPAEDSRPPVKSTPAIEKAPEEVATPKPEDPEAKARAAEQDAKTLASVVQAIAPSAEDASVEASVVPETEPEAARPEPQSDGDQATDRVTDTARTSPDLDIETQKTDAAGSDMADKVPADGEATGAWSGFGGDGIAETSPDVPETDSLEPVAGEAHTGPASTDSHPAEKGAVPDRSIRKAVAKKQKPKKGAALANAVFRTCNEFAQETVLLDTEGKVVRAYPDIAKKRWQDMSEGFFDEIAEWIERTSNAIPGMQVLVLRPDHNQQESLCVFVIPAGIIAATVNRSDLARVITVTNLYFGWGSD